MLTFAFVNVLCVRDRGRIKSLQRKNATLSVIYNY